MLAPLSFRICCFAVMAPALTEAATQAQQTFKLPPSPASSSSNSNPPSPLGTLTERYITNDFLTHTNNFNKNKHHLNSSGDDLIITKRKQNISDTSIGKRKLSDESLQNQTYRGQIDSLENTMNKSELILEPENMGIQQESAKLALETHPRIEIEMANVKEIIDVDTPSSSPYSSSLDNSHVDNVKINSSEFVSSSELPASTSNFSLTNKNLARSLSTSVPAASKRMAMIEKRTERLLHRLHKLQFKQCEKHLSDQLKSLIDQQRVSFSVACGQRYNCNNSVSSAELLQSEDMKNMSTAALVNLVRKLEAKNGPSALKHKPNLLSFIGLNNAINSNDNGINHDKIDLKDSSCIYTDRNFKLSSEKCNEVRRVSGTVTNNLRILENAFDSDATDSSSGGESCDELDLHNEKEKTTCKTLPLHRRAAWKWAVDRAAVASRWTWLQAQISDLEYRIRKQTDSYKQLRSSKIPVCLGNVSSVPSEICDLCTFKRSEMKEAHLTIPVLECDSINNSASPELTAKTHQEIVKKMLSSSVCEHVKPSYTDSRTYYASRVRPLESNFKRRKLLKCSDIYKLNPRSSKSNMVRCRCLPHTQCIMCGGQYESVQPIETDSLYLDDKIAAVDPSYHSVLSFKQDISLPVRFERLLKGGEWQKVNSKSHLLLKKKSNIALNNHARSHSKKLAKSAAAQLLSSAKLRKKLVDKKHGRAILPTKNGASLRKKRAAAKMALALKKGHLLDHGQFGTSSGSSSKTGSPVPSPIPHDMPTSGPGNIPLNNSILADATRKRRDSAYDIDNIVIPYSMTAATRIEKLQYKEILTPKWRVVGGDDDDDVKTIDVHEKENAIKNDNLVSNEEEFEDISEDAYITRHNICEALEKKRFLGIVNQPAGRSRARVSRIDSRLDSSGANTPDPLSPNVVDQIMNDNISPINSPVTPISHSEDSMPSTPSSSVHGNHANRLQDRRRTISVSSKDFGISKVGYESQPMTPELKEPPIIPFEPRNFPLSDEEYNELLEISSKVQDSPIERPDNLSNKTSKFSLVPSMEADLSRPTTPEIISSASGSLVDDHEDPNDPEWTVISDEKAVQRQSSIVLKLTKR